MTIYVAADGPEGPHQNRHDWSPRAALYSLLTYFGQSPPVTSIDMGERSMSIFNRFAKDDSGATAIEYGLIAALVSVAIIAVLGTLGENLNSTFKSVSDQLGGGAAGGPVPPR